MYVCIYIYICIDIFLYIYITIINQSIHTQSYIYIQYTHISFHLYVCRIFVGLKQLVTLGDHLQVAGRPLDRFSKAGIKDLMHGKVGVKPWETSDYSGL